MADLNTDIRNAQLQRGYSRAVSPSFRPLQKSIRYARFDYTFGATPSADDNVVLGELLVSNAEILPEKCRVASLNGAVQGVFRLEKVDASGTVTALSGDATVNDDDVALPRISSNDTVQAESGDYLQLTIPTVTAIASDDIISIEVAYASDDLQ